MNTDSSLGIPKIPKFEKEIAKKEKPRPLKAKSVPRAYEHSWELLMDLMIKGAKNLPKIIKSILVPLAAVTVVNIILGIIPTYKLGGLAGKLVFALIFLTASYNSLIPRTIFWIAIFTVGKRLLIKVKNFGLAKTFSDFKQLSPNIKNSLETLGKKKNFVLMAALGLGLITANYLTRNNRFDKAFVPLVLAISIADTLLKGKDSLLFTGLKLIHRDLSGLAKKRVGLSDSHVFVTALGFMLGLTANLLFAVIEIDRGGYIAGLILAVAGIVTLHKNDKVLQGNDKG